MHLLRAQSLLLAGALSLVASCTSSKPSRVEVREEIPKGPVEESEQFGKYLEHFDLPEALRRAFSEARPGDEIVLEAFPSAPGQRRSLELRRHEIYAPGAKIWVLTGSESREAPRSRLMVFRGRSPEDPDLRAGLVFDPERGTLSGLISGRNGSYEIFAPEAGEPLERHRVQLPRSIPGMEELASGCGVEGLPPELGQQAQAPSGPPGAPAPLDAPGDTADKQAVVAVDTDNELLYFKWGNNTTQATNWLVDHFNRLNVLYERELPPASPPGVQLRLLQGITFLRVDPNPADGSPFDQDPYQQHACTLTSCPGLAASGSFLSEFGAYWAASYSDSGDPECSTDPTPGCYVPRVNAMLLSGKSFSVNSGSGIATLDRMCATQDPGGAYSATKIFKSSYPGPNADLVGHELGHNYGSPHTHCYNASLDGISGPIDNCYSGESGCYSGTTSCPPAGAGTLMSYCHLNQVCGQFTQNFSEFHPRAANYTRTRILANASPSCITDLCTSPGVPTGLSASPNGDNRIDLSWTASNPLPSGTTYSVWRSLSSGGPYSSITSGLTATSHSDTSVAGSVTYYYVVRADNGGCHSAFSGESSATAQGDCNEGPVFSGAQSVAQVGTSCILRVQWSAATSLCGGLGYNVYRSTSAGFVPGPSNLLASCVSGTSYDDASVTPSTTYYYVVRAEDGTSGHSGPCNAGNQDSNTAQRSGSAVGPTSSTTLLDEDFDDGQAQGWTLGSGWPGVQGCAASSSPNILRFGGASCTDDYTTNVNGITTSPAVQVPTGASNLRLSFAHRRDFAAVPDGAQLAVFDGSVYRLFGNQYFTGELYNAPSLGAWGAPGFSGTSSGYPSSFATTVFDLSAFCRDTWSADDCGGRTLRFAFIGYSNGDGSRGEGWFIDDVLLTGDVPGSCVAGPSPLDAFATTAADQQIVLQWMNPSSGGYASTMIRFRTDTFPSSPTDGTLLVDQNDGAGNRGRTVHTGRTNGTTYYYSAFVTNGAGGSSNAAQASARPFDTTGAVRWEYSTGATALAPPGIGSVVVPSFDGLLHVLDESSGEWKSGFLPTSLGAPVSDRPPTFSGVSYVAAQDGRVAAVSSSSGSILWQTGALASMFEASPALSFSEWGGMDLVFAATRDGSGSSSLFALERATGSTHFQFTNSAAQGGDGTPIGIVSGMPQVLDAPPRIIFASRKASGGTYTLWSVDYSQSPPELHWAVDVGESDGSPTYWNNRLLLGTNAGAVLAIDPADGSTVWSRSFGDGAVKGWIMPRPATNDLIFSTGTTVRAVSWDGNTTRWAVSTVPNPSTPLHPFGSSFVYVGGADGALHEIDFSGGSPVIKSVTLGAAPGQVGSPALNVSDSSLFVGTESGKVYKVATPLP